MGTVFYDVGGAASNPLCNPSNATQRDLLSTKCVSESRFKTVASTNNQTESRLAIDGREPYGSSVSCLRTHLVRSRVATVRTLQYVLDGHMVQGVDLKFYRWYMQRGVQNYPKAYAALCELRNSRLQAARDLFYIHCLLYAEREIQTRHQPTVEIFTVSRNRRALQASFVVMFMQVLT